jgi:hypothetical protein
VKSSEGIFYGERLHGRIGKRHYSFPKEIFTLWSIPRLFVVGLPAYFLGNQEVPNAILLPVMLFLYIRCRIEHFNPKSLTSRSKGKFTGR